MDTRALATQRFSTRILANIHRLSSKRARKKQLRQLEVLLYINRINTKQGFQKRDYFRLSTRNKVAAI